MQLTITVPDPPEGFEYTGEYRLPKGGEWFLQDKDGHFEAMQAYHDHAGRPRFTLRKKRWRATGCQPYYCVLDDGTVFQAKDYGTVSQRRYDAGNYFQTEQEAKESAICKAFHPETGDTE